MKRLCCLVIACCWILSTSTPLWAHQKGEPSFHDAVANIRNRLSSAFAPEALELLTFSQVEDFITPGEREILATEKMVFTVNSPVVVSVLRDSRFPEEPFWLVERGFEPTDLRLQVGGRDFDVWRKEFEAGPIGLGANSLTGRSEAYVVAVAPQNPGDPIKVTSVYPGQIQVGVLKNGEFAYSDDDDRVQEVPEELQGQILLRTLEERQEESQLVGYFRTTPYPADGVADHVVLTWSEDPKTTQTIQWRTGPAVTKGAVSYMKKSDYHAFQRGAPAMVQAESQRLETMNIANDPVNYRHTAVLRNLEADTTYDYSVGDGTEKGWTELAEFTTAPDGVEPFSFIYMGDAQNGLERWGSLLHNAFRHRPDAAFHVLAGDLINRGQDRDDWDTFFENAEGVFDRRQFVPALGNHEYQGGDPWLYRDMFTLPLNGPESIKAEHAYSFEYSNAIFIILDSNVPPETQTEWLEEQLSKTSATWKFVMYHHPAYSSGPNRDNPEIRKLWGDIFDKYHVDLALQGHDHAYLRTFPMKNQQRVESPADGTIYVVSVSGTKYYEQDDRGYTEFGMTRVSTYQAIDIQISVDRLLYRCYDIDGRLRDEFEIEK